jgi:hypothetical protein
LCVIILTIFEGGPTTNANWWQDHKPLNETEFFPQAAFDTPNLFLSEWILPEGSNESRDIQPMWDKLTLDLQKNTSLKSVPYSRPKTVSIGTRRPSFYFYFLFLFLFIFCFFVFVVVIFVSKNSHKTYFIFRHTILLSQQATHRILYGHHWGKQRYNG